MTDLLMFILAGVMALCAILMFATALRVGRSGAGTVAELRRKDYGLKNWATGHLIKTDDGPTLREYEGLAMRSKDGILHSVRQTRAPTSDF